MVIEVSNIPEYKGRDYYDHEFSDALSSRAISSNDEKLREDGFTKVKLAQMSHFLENGSADNIPTRLKLDWLIWYYGNIERDSGKADKYKTQLEGFKEEKKALTAETREAIKEGQPALGQIVEINKWGNYSESSIDRLDYIFSEKVIGHLEKLKTEKPESFKEITAEILLLSEGIRTENERQGKDMSIPRDVSKLFSYIQSTAEAGLIEGALDLQGKSLQEQIDMYKEKRDPTTKNRILSYIYNENIEKKGLKIAFDGNSFCFKDEEGNVVKNENIELIEKCFSKKEMQDFMKWRESDEGEVYTKNPLDPNLLTAMSPEEAAKYVSKLSDSYAGKLLPVGIIAGFLAFGPWKGFKGFFKRLAAVVGVVVLNESFKQTGGTSLYQKGENWIDEMFSEATGTMGLDGKPKAWRESENHKSFFDRLLILQSGQENSSLNPTEITELYTIAHQSKTFKNCNIAHIKAYSEGKGVKTTQLFGGSPGKLDGTPYTNTELREFTKLLLENSTDLGDRDGNMLLKDYHPADVAGSTDTPPASPTVLAAVAGTTETPPEATALAEAAGTTETPPEATALAEAAGTTETPPEATALTEAAGTTETPPEATALAEAAGTTETPPEVAEREVVAGSTESLPGLSESLWPSENVTLPSGENIEVYESLGFTRDGANYIVGENGEPQLFEGKNFTPEFMEQVEAYEEVYIGYENVLLILVALISSGERSDDERKKLLNNKIKLEETVKGFDVTEVLESSRTIYTAIEEIKASIGFSGNIQDSLSVYNYIRDEIEGGSAIVQPQLVNNLFSKTEISDDILAKYIEGTLPNKKEPETEDSTGLNIAGVTGVDTLESEEETRLRIGREKLDNILGIDYDYIQENIAAKRAEAERYFLEYKDELQEAYPDTDIENIKEFIIDSFVLPYAKDQILYQKLSQLSDSKWSFNEKGKEGENNTNSELELYADISGFGLGDISDKNKFYTKEAFKVIAFEAAAIGAGILTAGAATAAAHALVWGTRGVKVAGMMHRTGRIADRAIMGNGAIQGAATFGAKASRLATMSVVEGAAFHTGWHMTKDSIEGTDSDFTDGLGQSIMMVGAFRGLQQVFKMMGVALHPNVPLSQQKLKLLKQVSLETSVFAAMGLQNDGVLFEPGEWSAETLLQALTMAAGFKAMGIAVNKVRFGLDNGSVVARKLKKEYTEVKTSNPKLHADNIAELTGKTFTITQKGKEYLVTIGDKTENLIVQQIKPDGSLGPQAVPRVGKLSKGGKPQTLEQFLEIHNIKIYKDNKTGEYFTQKDNITRNLDGKVSDTLVSNEVSATISGGIRKLKPGETFTLEGVQVKRVGSKYEVGGQSFATPREASNYLYGQVSNARFLENAVTNIGNMKGKEMKFSDDVSFVIQELNGKNVLKQKSKNGTLKEVQPSTLSEAEVNFLLGKAFGNGAVGKIDAAVVAATNSSKKLSDIYGKTFWEKTSGSLKNAGVPDEKIASILFRLKNATFGSIIGDVMKISQSSSSGKELATVLKQRLFSKWTLLGAPTIAAIETTISPGEDVLADFGTEFAINTLEFATMNWFGVLLAEAIQNHEIAKKIATGVKNAVEELQ